MGNILQIGFTTEGSTDERFLSNIIQKSFENAVLNCNSEIEVYEPMHLRKHGDGYVNQITHIATEYSYFHVICVHCDADAPTIEKVMNEKMNPSFTAVDNLESNACKNLVAIIPVQMTEAWILADCDLLKEKIGASKINAELGLPVRIREIEAINNPKETISNAIRVAQSNLPRRRRKLTISNLYTPISQEISIDNLMQLSSYSLFMENIEHALRKLNYLP